jgi:hypothetical protein
MSYLPRESSSVASYLRTVAVLSHRTGVQPQFGVKYPAAEGAERLDHRTVGTCNPEGPPCPPITVRLGMGGGIMHTDEG